MSKGYENHQQRKQALSLLGKDLARRCKSSCELCAATGESLHIYEVAPVPQEPEIESCLMLCGRCHSQLENPKTLDPDHWRCLNTAIWSDLPIVQVMAIRLLKALDDHSWTRDLIEQAYLDPEVENRAMAAPISP